jgi:hypothetical protein
MNDKNLLDPKNNELIPGFEIPAEPPNELCPDYIEPPARPDRTPTATIDALENALRESTVDPCAFDDGLQLRRGEEGGLHVFKDERIIRDMASLEPFELSTIKKYLEGSK